MKNVVIFVIGAALGYGLCKKQFKSYEKLLEASDENYKRKLKEINRAMTTVKGEKADV